MKVVPIKPLLPILAASALAAGLVSCERETEVVPDRDADVNVVPEPTVTPSNEITPPRE